MTQNAARTVTLDVTILGRDFKVACKEDERDELLEAVALLDRRMREIRDAGKVSGTDRIAVMAGLNIAHELLRERRSSVERKTRDMIRRGSPSTHGPQPAANPLRPKPRGVESRQGRQRSTRHSPDRKICSNRLEAVRDMRTATSTPPIPCGVRSGLTFFEPMLS